MKLNPFTRRATTSPEVAATDRVRARKVKGGSVLLRHGTNLFRFDPQAYARISVGKGDDELFHLYGHSLAAGPVSLAQFATAKAAQNGHAAVCAAYGGFRSHGAVKWVVGLVLGYGVLSLLFGTPSAPAQASPVPMASQLAAPAQPAMHWPAMGSAPAPGFDPNEPTLEQLAAGQYRFQPDIKVPDIAAPVLDCAPR